MVSGQVKATGRHKPPKATKHSDYSCGGSPLPAEPPSDANIPNLPLPTQKASGGSKAKNSCQTGPKKHKSTSEEKYLGVRVRMPVRDMLKNIRIAKGIDPKDLQEKHSKASKGDKKRVNTGGNRRCFLKHQTKSLEELAIIVEVLEEDLKTCQSYRLPNKSPSASYSSEFWVEDASPQGFMNTNGQENEIPLSPSYSVPSETSPVHSVSSSYPSPTYSQGADVFLENQEEYSSYESDNYRYDGLYGMSCSPANSCEYQVHSPQESFNASPNPEVWEVSSQTMNCPPWPHSQHEEWSGMTFFLTQLEREENLLQGISDQELFAVDGNGRILLHRVVEEGKRSLVYVIARRMAALKKLDIKDSEGKTPLHLAAQKNQHFMVVDLVSLGANINAKDRYGKTCLHLSAENGYIRVLEVLKGLMRNGVYINLEERDANGLSALQCAAVALNHTVRELELCGPAGWVGLHTLRKEQMIETLECLLQMECYLHTPVQDSYRFTVDSKLCEQATFFQSNEIKARNNMN
ncbi:NF-kappa-B inhibitor zeta-like [Sinocyclocheilus rhinocerous]|uniref:NF-kappa-B inhibitor zeta-like n=1 Tax=Sinocyclocheilus rhinocerous TaxID=307959 RepID=UPI0007B85AB1|nr:PREDICTED: NF-kappa-B inhibitor zeta-like [Sinocyclocheilus rhinocerous]